MRKSVVVFATALLLIILMVGVVQADPPPVSGIVTRGEIPLGVSWIDEAKGQRILIGLRATEFCSGSEDFALVSFQDVDLTEERFVEIVKGDDLPTDVYPFLDFDCARFLTDDPVGLGTADIVGTDNDLPGLSPGEKHANAWGWSAHLRLIENSSGFHLNERINVN